MRDELLTARKALHNVLTSTLPGTPLYQHMLNAISSVDAALTSVRDARGADGMNPVWFFVGGFLWLAALTFAVALGRAASIDEDYERARAEARALGDLVSSEVRLSLVPDDSHVIHAEDRFGGAA